MPSALPGYLNEADMRQSDRTAFQRSDCLKAINFTNIMHKGFDKASNYAINRPEKPRYQGISYPLEVRPCFMFHHISCAVSPPRASYVEANLDVAETENSDFHGFSHHLSAGKAMTSRHCKLMVLNKPIYPHISKQFLL